MVNLLQNHNKMPFERKRSSSDILHVVKELLKNIYTTLISRKITITKLQLNVIGISCIMLGVGVGIFFTLTNILNKVFAAGDMSTTWTFAASGDYTLSDTSLAEITANTARLKVQNYSNDANTVALYHLDENSDVSLGDSSTNGNTATGVSVGWAAGNLNYAMSFNGINALASAPDSASLSIVQHNSIEAWLQFPSTFSANSNASRQYIVDKGDYALYYDNETGKVVYELAPSSADSFLQVAGLNGVTGGTRNSTWDVNGKPFVFSQAIHGGDLYIGLGGAISDAEVWKCVNCNTTAPTWTQVGGDGTNSGWADGTFEEVTSMVSNGTNLYVGLGNSTNDAEVWRYNGATWTKIGGDAVNSSWNTNYERVSSLAANGSAIFAGLGNSAAGDAEVWRCLNCDTSASWGGALVGGDGTGWANTVFEEVTNMAVAGTALIIGLGNSAGDSDLYRTNLNTISWSKIGGDGTATGGQSWASVQEGIYSLAVSGNFLYVGLGLTASATPGASDSSVWRCDLSVGCTTTTGWTKIGGHATGSSWDINIERVWSLAADGTTLYAGLGETAGDNQLWRCINCTGSSPTWGIIGGNTSGWTNTHTQIQKVIVDTANSYVYTGMSHSGSTASSQVWGTSTSSISWDQKAGNYRYKSWGFIGLNSVESLTTANGFLFAGTGNATAGNALVWKFDGTTWSLVGGQGINNSWTQNTYESVVSMVDVGGSLYAGLGTSTTDAEVWVFSGTAWTKIGGDGLNSSWNTTFETIPAMAEYNGMLYASVGNNAANEAEVWSWNAGTTAWTKMGGDGVNTSWNTSYESVQTLRDYNGFLIAGLGVTGASSPNADSEVWRYTTGTSAWTKIGGDGLNSSWSHNIELVDAMAEYQGDLYVGLGNTSNAAIDADAEVWQCKNCDGSIPVWTKIGGDGVGTGWVDLTYERVRSMAVFNGRLVVGLGVTAGDSETWSYDGTSWTKTGGDGSNSGWTSLVENIPCMAVYDGKLYVGNGDTANTDAAIYAYGGNAVLKSTSATQDTSWNHVAATYDGTTMNLYLNGTLNNSATASLSLLNTTIPLYIGSSLGSPKAAEPSGHFKGLIDELRVSDTYRSSFTTAPYTTQTVTVRPNTAVYTSSVLSWAGFATSATLNGGTISFRLSINGGSTWKYWDGAAWSTSNSTAQASTTADINSNIATLPVNTSGIMWQGIMSGDGTQQVTLNTVTIEANSDNVAPTTPNSITALDTTGGTNPLTTNTFYSHSAPYFSWGASTDIGGSGVEGYWVYFGTDISGEPTQVGTFQNTNYYVPASLISNTTYYLRVRARDNAQNLSSTYAAFIYKYDITGPNNPSDLFVTPSGYTATNSYTFFWSAPPGATEGTDTSGAGVAGYQYKTGAASGPYSTWSATTTDTSITIPDIAYQDGLNIFYVRTIDNAGNVSSTTKQVNFYFAGTAPTPPQNLQVSPSSPSSTNSFAFSWQAPTTYVGTAADITYCYTINTLPSDSTCTYTSAGATSLSAQAFANQPGENTFYLAARDGTGNISYTAYTNVSFTADTAAPGIPLNVEIADVSVKTTSSWKIALSWEAPSGATGDLTYEVYHSIDGSTYTFEAEVSGIAHIDTGLTQVLNYYKVRACDSTNNCGAFTEPVSLLPNGRYTSAATATSDPTVTEITTKQATITWSTDRTSDTKIAYGTKSEDYFSEEPSNSDQVTEHTITLTNLKPGVKYYFVAKWSDEDGNLGTSSEISFKTDPAPTVTDPKVIGANLTTATLQYTVEGASKVRIYYGKTSAFGLITDISTSTSSTKYNTILEELEDGTKYYYKVNTFDSEGEEYEGSTLSFETLPRPKITNIRIQQVVGTAQPTAVISWITNTETSSIVTFYPAGNAAEARDEVNVELIKDTHRVILRGLSPQTPYVLLVKGRDKSGNEATSEPQNFTTATDTRPPVISELNVEGTTTQNGGSDTFTAQLIVNWNTDEPGTSQVEFGEGTGANYSQRTQEDSTLAYNHSVIISGLTPAKVYHLRVITKDSANNSGYSIDTVTITPKASDSALNLVINNLSQVFGFLNFGQQ